MPPYLSEMSAPAFSNENPSPKRGHFQSGFTLLELIVVMAIVAMVVAMVIPHIGSGEVTILKVQVREAMATLRYARRSAIVEGKQKVAIFKGGKTADKSTTKAMPGQWVSRGATLQWGNEVSDDGKTGDKDETGIYKITFYPEGGNSGGELILTYLDHKATISVNPITGKIESDIFNDEEKD